MTRCPNGPNTVNSRGETLAINFFSQNEVENEKR